MSKKISKATRDAAAHICALAASNPDLGQYYNGVLDALDWPSGESSTEDSNRLALSAWRVCQYSWDSNVDAEAEALLRCGWSPGEPTITRRRSRKP